MNFANVKKYILDPENWNISRILVELCENSQFMIDDNIEHSNLTEVLSLFPRIGILVWKPFPSEI